MHSIYSIHIVASETYNLTWVNCEMASFIHMQASSKFYHEPKQEVLYCYVCSTVCIIARVAACV